MVTKETLKKLLWEVANTGGCDAIKPTYNMTKYINGKTDELVKLLKAEKVII